MTINLESIRSARAEMFKNELPVSMVVVQAYSNISAASSYTQPCTSCCTQCNPGCCNATYN